MRRRPVIVRKGLRYNILSSPSTCKEAARTFGMTTTSIATICFEFGVANPDISPTCTKDAEVKLHDLISASESRQAIAGSSIAYRLISKMY